MTIRVGLIGLNHGVEVHLPAYASSARYEVAAVCARTPGLAEGVAKNHNIPRWYTDAMQLISDPEIDLVSFATPPRTHAVFAAAALKAGKHVAIETPFVCNPMEARALMGLWRFKRIGAPAFALRYAPHLRLVSDLLAEKRLGRLLLMRVEIFSNFLAQAAQNYRWMWDGDNGGGVLANFTAPVIDVAMRWFGPVREVTANLATLLRTTPPEGAGTLADDTGFATLRFESGLLAHFSHSAVTAWPQTHMEVHGVDGTLIIGGFGDDLTLIRMGAGQTQPLYSPETYLEESRGHTGLAGGFQVFVDRLADAIVGSAASTDLPTFGEGLEIMRVVEAIKLSSRARRTVALTEIS